MSMDLNVIAMTGRVCNEPSVLDVGENSVCKISIAVHGMKDDDTSFFNCDFWNKNKEFLSTIKKGSLCSISGRLKQEKWEKDGQKRQAVKIIIEKFNYINTGIKKEPSESVETDEVPF